MWWNESWIALQSCRKFRFIPKRIKSYLRLTKMLKYRYRRFERLLENLDRGYIFFGIDHIYIYIVGCDTSSGNGRDIFLLQIFYFNTKVLYSASTYCILLYCSRYTTILLVCSLHCVWIHFSITHIQLSNEWYTVWIICHQMPISVRTEFGEDKVPEIGPSI